MLNDLQLTFADYLNAKDKYQLTEETKKCIEKLVSKSCLRINFF